MAGDSDNVTDKGNIAGEADLMAPELKNVTLGGNDGNHQNEIPYSKGAVCENHVHRATCVTRATHQLCACPTRRLQKRLPWCGPESATNHCVNVLYPGWVKVRSGACFRAAVSSSL